MQNPQIVLGGYILEVDLVGREARLFPDKKAATLYLKVQFTPYCSAKGEKDMVITLTIDQKVTVSLSAVDAVGNPAKLESVTWETSDPTLATVIPNETDPASAVVFTSGPLGMAQIVARADARFGPDVKELIGILDVEIVAGEAVALTLNTGAPEPK